MSRRPGSERGVTEADRFYSPAATPTSHPAGERAPESGAKTKPGVNGSSSLPVWLVALILAAIAPGCVRALHAVFERRLRRRTLDAIARAWPIAGAAGAGRGAKDEAAPANRPPEASHQKREA